MKEPVFIETMRLTHDGLAHIEYHQARVDRTARTFGLSYLDLEQYIRHKIPQQLPASICRCRLLYGDVEPEVMVAPYVPLQRKVVRLVENDDIEYSYKYADRDALNRLVTETRACDIIIVKNGLLTDSAIANLVFNDSSGRYTPRIPLLMGTAITRFVDEGMVEAADIRPKDLRDFVSVTFVNALGQFTYPISILYGE